MSLLIFYVLIAIVVSFACSIFEAVLLSTNRAHVALLKKNNKVVGFEADRLKRNIGQPLAAILTLNTIAHTIGAAGAGAQASIVFGNAYLGLFSAVLTLLILVFSEIIPKTIGASYWKQLLPLTVYSLKYLVIGLYPFIKLSESITNRFSHGSRTKGLSREEFMVMAELSNQGGQLLAQESHFLSNLMKLHQCSVKNAMTPRTVVFSLNQSLLVQEFFHKYDQVTFSRILVFEGDSENIIGYVFRSDLLLAQARGNGEQPLANYVRKLPALLLNSPLFEALNQMLELRTHIILIVDEYGTMQGIVTMEDVVETMLGFEIVDEKDKAVDMKQEAIRQKKRKDKNSQHDQW